MQIPGSTQATSALTWVDVHYSQDSIANVSLAIMVMENWSWETTVFGNNGQEPPSLRAPCAIRCTDTVQGDQTVGRSNKRKSVPTRRVSNNSSDRRLAMSSTVSPANNGRAASPSSTGET